MQFVLRAAICITLIATLITGCKQSSNGANSATVGDQKTFVIRGKIVSVDAAKGMVMLDHEAVPGFMEAMTMPYKLKNPTVAGTLHPGDRITAKLLVRNTDDGFQDPMLDEIVVTAQARPNFKPAAQVHVPTAGDTVPDFKLTNQDGRTLHLSQFKGRVILLTFVYTRCPLPDFCIRMSRNFAQIDKALQADPALYAKTHLLSISFDPKYDTPTVLKSYGMAYTGSDAKQTFAHWDFAVPPASELAAITHFFDVGISQDNTGLLTHSMSTALIGKDGKVYAWYPTNEWTTTEVLTAIKSAASA